MMFRLMSAALVALLLLGALGAWLLLPLEKLI